MNKGDPIDIDDFDKVCPLHDQELLDGTVPAFFGFFGTSSNYAPAWRNAFRYANSWAAGGCSVAAGKPSTREVKYCPICRDAERTWLAEQIAHGVDKDSWEWELAGVLGMRNND